MKKTTDKHYKYFQSRCRHYQKELGLVGWDITFVHSDIGGFASIRSNSDAKAATIFFATKWGWPEGEDLRVPLNRKELDFSAFHEIMHLRLTDLAWIGKSRWTTPDEIDRVEEEVVTALENFYRSLI